MGDLCIPENDEAVVEPVVQVGSGRAPGTAEEDPIDQKYFCCERSVLNFFHLFNGKSL